jgi:putative transposase
MVNGFRFRCHRTGRRIKVLTLIDEATRECLALEVDTSITGKRVTSILNKAAFFRGTPEEILTDNGSEFTSNALSEWAYEKKINRLFIDPGKRKTDPECFH